MLYKIIFSLWILVLGFAFCELTSRDLGSLLKSYSEEGYRFEGDGGTQTWYLSFKLPTWKSAWPLLVQMSSDKKGSSVVSIGTTIQSFTGTVPATLLSYLMKRNGDENNIGAVSIYEADKTYVQYFVKLPTQFATSEQVIYAIGWVAAYANFLSEKIQTSMGTL
jgi:hypothetical protein